MPCPSQTMSLTVQQILSDAKRLVSRLREHDNSADGLISQTQSLNKKVDAMKRYNEDLNELNEVARQRPRSALVLGIQQENRHIRELQQENKELRSLLEEHQAALELIMSKYRQHVMQLVMSNKAQNNGNRTDNEQMELLQNHTEKIYEMAAVMSRAVTIDSEALAQERERFARVLAENQGLRELLEISCQSGSMRRPLLAESGTDAAVQTDDVTSSSS